MSGSLGSVYTARTGPDFGRARSAPERADRESELEVDEAQLRPLGDAAGARRLRERRSGMWEGVGADPLQIEVGGRTGVHQVYSVGKRIP